jgi:hypothetical protein
MNFLSVPRANGTRVELASIRLEAEAVPDQDYTEIQRAVERAGFFTTLNPQGDDGDWLVLASRRTKGRLHGNSFRLAVKGGRWYLVTWTPAYYVVAPGTDLTSLCLDCLRASPSPLTTVPPDLAARHQLVEVSEDEFERA